MTRVLREASTVTIGSQRLTTQSTVGNTWSVTATELSAGIYSVTVKVKDASGSGATAMQALTVEVNPPTVVLGRAAPYSLLAGLSITNTGTSQIGGDIGVSPGTTVTLVTRSRMPCLRSEATKLAAARIGATVCELLGPTPMLNRSKTLTVTPSSRPLR